MTKLKALALISSSALVFALSAAQTTAPAKPPSTSSTHRELTPQAKAQINKDAGKTALPTKEQVDDYMKRNFGYDPGVSWQIYAIRESEVPGLAEIILSFNKGEPSHLYYSASAQVALPAGQVLPFGPNPFAKARTKLKGAFGPSRGPATSPIEIVEFSDLECPYCKQAQPIVEKLSGDFPQVRITFQQFPLPASVHPWAHKAAQYADCAAQMNKDNFWKYIDSVFDAQGGIALATADDKLKELATAAGYDGSAIAQCAASPATEARVQKSLDLGAALAVNQTPTVFVNGRPVLGLAAIPYDTLKKLVQFEIDHAGK